VSEMWKRVETLTCTDLDQIIAISVCLDEGLQLVVELADLRAVLMYPIRSNKRHL
jgi:hypothetical protein